MKSGYNIPLIACITSAFLWAGMVCGISFLESWIKFQAPGITVALGVGIGQLVFGLLNKVELALAVIILITWWWLHDRNYKINGIATYGLAIGVLLIQTLVLLPAMDQRAQQLLDGISVPTSNLHIYYVGGEFIKVVGLHIFGIVNMKSITKS